MSDIDHLIERIAAKAREGRSAVNLSPPVPKNDLVALEKELNFDLPPLLRRLYSEISDGEFGPGYGLVPIRKKSGDYANDPTFSSLYEAWRDTTYYGEEWCWDDWLIPLNNWGCAVYGCFDASEEDGAVYRFNWTAVTPGSESEDYLDPTHDSLTDWFEDWLAGSDCW